MRTPVHGKTPTQWLTGLGISASDQAEVLASFQPGALSTVNRYNAPHTFVRFHGRGSSKAIYAPNYWADGSALTAAFGRASQFGGFLTADEISRIAKNYYREITAICRNWNDLESNTLWMITLRGSETVEGLEGPAAPQPTFARDRKTGAPPTASVLPGGAIQVYLHPKSPFLCTPVNW